MTADALGTVVIRDGRPGDVEAMAWARSEDQRDAWRRQADRASVGEVSFIVAEFEGRVVGKAVLDWVHDPDGTPWLWMGSVDPDYRSRGIGTLLLGFAEARAQERGHSSIEMCVDDDNPRARDLYLRSGYVVVGLHVDEYVEVQSGGGVVRVANPGVRLRKSALRAQRHER